MSLVLLWRLLHFFFAFGFVGTMVVCDWNSRAARGTEDWGQRALLWGIVRRAAAVGLGTLLALGIMGNLGAAPSQEELLQQRYDIMYGQCMAAHGNSVASFLSAPSAIPCSGD